MFSLRMTVRFVAAIPFLGLALVAVLMAPSVVVTLAASKWAEKAREMAKADGWFGAADLKR
jgi:hypothetical protein